jgi:hypothetical protein
MGRMGGVIPMPDEVEAEVREWLACQPGLAAYEWLEGSHD